MGSSQSKNVASTTVEAVTNVSSEIINKSASDIKNSNIIRVEDTGGNVDIKNNKFIQKAKINMQNLQKSISSTQAQQDITQQLQQQAKSLTQGLNLFQFSDAQNEMDAYLKASIQIVTNTSQECASQLEQKNIIDVQKTKGNVTIMNNIFEQVADFYSQCLQDAVVQNKSIQKLQQTLDQSAEATSKGQNLALILAMLIFGAIMLILVPLLEVFSIVKIIMKILFPLMLLAGVVFIVLYFTQIKKGIKMYPFSQQIQNTPICNSTQAQQSMEFKNPIAASQKLNQNGDWVAMDWRGYTLDSEGKATPLPQPVTIFYSALQNNKCLSGATDKHKIIFKPQAWAGRTPPSTDPILQKLTEIPDSSLYVDSSQTNYYFFKNNQWELQGRILPKDPGNQQNRKIFFGFAPNPPTSIGNTKDIYINLDNPNIMDIYIKEDDQKWEKVDENNPPGPGFSTRYPKYSNTSGIKYKVKNNIYLFIGISLIVIGLIGTIFTFYKRGGAKNRKK